MRASCVHHSQNSGGDEWWSVALIAVAISNSRMLNLWPFSWGFMTNHSWFTVAIRPSFQHEWYCCCWWLQTLIFSCPLTLVLALMPGLLTIYTLLAFVRSIISATRPGDFSTWYFVQKQITLKYVRSPTPILWSTRINIPMLPKFTSVEVSPELHDTCIRVLLPINCVDCSQNVWDENIFLVIFLHIILNLKYNISTIAK